jgi:predicted transcriptional regulator
MRATKAVSISLPPKELRQAVRLAQRTNRSLSGLVREGLRRLHDEHRTIERLAEYTPAQRRFIDARIAEGLEDFRNGRFYGPFETADEAIASLKANLQRRSVQKKMKSRAR